MSVHRAVEYKHLMQKCDVCGEILIDDRDAYDASGQPVDRTFNGTAWPVGGFVRVGPGYQSLHQLGPATCLIN